MNLLLRKARTLRKELSELRTYFDFNKTGNRVTRRTDFSKAQRPVLLLHGFMSTRRVLNVVEHRLRRDGYYPFSLHLGGFRGAFNTRGIDEIAEHVRDKVERLYSRFPTMGPLSIIGHSMGGLVGRYYVKRLGGDQRVKNLITLGSPHNGSPTSYLGIVGYGLLSRGIWQMTPMSPFIRRLKMGAFPRDVRFVSIFSKDDKVNPFPCCILEDDGTSNLLNLEVMGLTHREYLIDRTVYRLVRQQLAVGFGEDVVSQPRRARMAPVP